MEGLKGIHAELTPDPRNMFCSTQLGICGGKKPGMHQTGGMSCPCQLFMRYANTVDTERLRLTCVATSWRSYRALICKYDTIQRAGDHTLWIKLVHGHQTTSRWRPSSRFLALFTGALAPREVLLFLASVTTARAPKPVSSVVDWKLPVADTQRTMSFHLHQLLIPLFREASIRNL